MPVLRVVMGMLFGSHTPLPLKRHSDRSRIQYPSGKAVDKKTREQSAGPQNYVPATGRMGNPIGNIITMDPVASGERIIPTDCIVLYLLPLDAA